MNRYLSNCCFLIQRILDSMSDNNNKSLSTATAVDVTTLSAEETKQILTPFAFEINKTLFGLPLAVPRKRAFALLIDFIIIAMLVKTSGTLLATLVGLTFFRLGSKKRAEQMGKRRGFRKLALRWLGALILLVVIIDNVPDLLEGQFGQNPSSESQYAETKQESDPTPTDPIEANTTPNKPDNVNDLLNDGVKWLVNLIDELGLSFGWSAFYFSVLTAVWNGQTPGKKLLGIRVVQLDGTPLSVWDSFGRYGGYGAGLATGLMGFFQIYWDPNRQAIHDKISSTIVIDSRAAKAIEHVGQHAGKRNNTMEKNT